MIGIMLSGYRQDTQCLLHSMESSCSLRKAGAINDYCNLCFWFSLPHHLSQCKKSVVRSSHLFSSIYFSNLFFPLHLLTAFIQALITLHRKLWFWFNWFWKNTVLSNGVLFIFLIAFHSSSEFLQTLSLHSIFSKKVNTSYILKMMPWFPFSYWHILSTMPLVARIEWNKW